MTAGELQAAAADAAKELAAAECHVDVLRQRLHDLRQRLAAHVGGDRDVAADVPRVVVANAK
jgi:hypothetical protein